MQGLLRIGKSQPAPPSQLLTNAHLRVELTNADWRGHKLAMLVLRDPSTTARLLAVVAKAQGSAASPTAYYWYPKASSRCEASEVDLVALEHMYRFAINDVVTDAFRFGAVARGREDSGPKLTHSQLLARIAKTRECVADALTTAGATPPKRWRNVSLEPAEFSRNSAVVSARLLSPRGPLVSATILFTRAPHLECSSTTDSTGLATCQLEDTHGHDDDDEVPGAPTVASYPGEVQSDLVLLPTTSVDRRKPGRATHPKEHVK
jgi:hypothetical protein